MNDYIISFLFNCKSVEEAYTLLQNTFFPVIIHCTNCIQVRRNFMEAFRDYLIAQGKCRNTDGSILGQYVIASLDHDIEEYGQDYEITFAYEGSNIYGSVAGKFLEICIYNISKENLDRFIARISSLFQITEMSICDLDKENKDRIIYKDLERRLEEGDIEGGERKSVYFPFDDGILS